MSENRGWMRKRRERGSFVRVWIEGEGYIDVRPVVVAAVQGLQMEIAKTGHSYAVDGGL